MRNNRNVKKSGIFIHSLFRTGSTHLWNKFRQNQNYYCYYEPFHQELAFLDGEHLKRWSSTPHVAESMGHPLLDHEYMQEYYCLLRPDRKGVPYFKKAFSFDAFCNNGCNSDQKKYIDFLLKGCGKKIPVMKFNRSSLRIEWFKKKYPEIFHIYLFRNPRDQFESYLKLREKRNLDIFLLMNLIAAGVNKRKCNAFRKLACHLPLFEYHADRFDKEEVFYRQLLPSYSYEEQYFIHYFIWFAALLKNLAHADMLLDIDWLSQDSAHHFAFEKRIENLTHAAVDFSDVKITPAETFCIPEKEATRIERTVHGMLLGDIDFKQLKNITDSFDSKNMPADNINREIWTELKKRKMFFVDDEKASNAKQEAIFSNLYSKIIEIKNRSILLKYNFVERTSLTKEMTGLMGGLRFAGFKKESQPERPLITVVTVVLNEVEKLKQTIHSVLQQSYPNIELIIIDGGSEKRTLDIIKEYEHKIDYWQSEPDKGIFDAMNKGIALARGEWINFLNCGDCFYRQDTVQTVFSRDYKGTDFIYGHSDFQGGDYFGIVKAWDFDILWQTMIFTHQSLFTRTEILKKRHFNTTYRICADYELIYNSWNQGLKFFNSDTVIASFHPGFSDISRARMAWEKWRVVKKHRNDMQFHIFYIKLFLKRLFRDIINRLKRRF